MDFLISNTEINENKFNHVIKLNKFFNLYIDYIPEIIKISSKKKIYIIGKVFGYYDGQKFFKSKLKNIPKKFKSYKRIKDSIEGYFLFLDVSDSKINLQIDNRGSLDVFYIHKKDKIFLSNNFLLIKKLFGNKLSLDNFSIMNSLVNVSKRPPLNNTFFKEVKRVGLDQNIICEKKNIKIKTQNYIPLKQENPKSEEAFLDQYNKSLINYSNIGNNKNKVLFMSSGWDSLMILKLLIDRFGRNRVKPIIARLKFSKKTKVFNRYEIKKAQKICRHFKIKLNFIDVDYQKIKNYLDYLDDISAKRMLTNTFAYFLHYNLVKDGTKKFGASDFFSGEISDGAHNFGFSQYLTLVDNESNGYREYCDKMMNYLFGPTFFKKIHKGIHEEDPVFQFLKNKLGIKTKKNIRNFKDIFKNIMQSMFAISNRFPLNNEISEFILPKKKAEYLKQFNKSYLSNLDFNDSNQLYSSYLFLYNKFHWQGSTVRPAYHISSEFKSDFINLFWNKNTQELLSIMPESYGRGLELKPTKYPEKAILSKKINTNELNTGPHSYISDDSDADPFFEIIYNSPVRQIIKKTFKEYNPIKILDKNYFNHKFINRIINSFNKKNNSINAETIYSLYCICKFFKDIKY
jgi:hypothetical protein